MASRQGPAPGAPATAPQQSEATEGLFLDILTKEEKEAMLNKKMEEIRKKNEALQRRHAVSTIFLNVYYKYSTKYDYDQYSLLDAFSTYNYYLQP